jgi:hypothetical protein
MGMKKAKSMHIGEKLPARARDADRWQLHEVGSAGKKRGKACQDQSM